jgi:hypothetical protein
MHVLFHVGILEVIIKSKIPKPVEMRILMKIWLFNPRQFLHSMDLFCIRDAHLSAS